MRGLRKGRRSRRCWRTSTCTTSSTCGSASGGVATFATTWVVVRFADDFVVGFEHRRDARRFLADLRERFAKFGLELHSEKTRLIEFGRFAADRRRMGGQGKPETFEFLGFTHICATTRDGRFKLARITSKKRMRVKLREVKTELRRRRHLPIPRARALAGERDARAPRVLRRARQRPDGARLPGAGHLALAQGAPAPQPAHEPDLEAHVPAGESMAPLLPHPAPKTNRAVRRPHPRQEPSALNVHAGICAGGRPRGRSLPRTYARGERSSRRIERHCEHDVAFGVIAANRVPDHATIARFRVRHKRAIAGLFGEVLALCAEAGLVHVGVVAVDATKVHANASQHATRDYEQIAAEILAE